MQRDGVAIDVGSNNGLITTGKNKQEKREQRGKKCFSFSFLFSPVCSWYKCSVTELRLIRTQTTVSFPDRKEVLLASEINAPVGDRCGRIDRFIDGIGRDDLRFRTRLQHEGVPFFAGHGYQSAE